MSDEGEAIFITAKYTNDHNEYFKGVVSGKKEFDMEKVRERLKGVSRNDAPSKDITKDKGREK